MRIYGGTDAQDQTDIGVKLSVRDKCNFIVVVYYTKHLNIVSHSAEVGEITLVNINNIFKMNKPGNNQVGPTTVPKVEPKDWYKTVELIEEYIYQLHGFDGIPLSYTTSKILNTIAKVDDPDITYMALDEDIISCS